MLAGCLLVACHGGHPGTAAIEIDLRAHPDLAIRVDALSGSSHDDAAALATLPGFAGHVVLERTGGPSPFDGIALTAWTNPDAMARGGTAVRDSGGYLAPAALQGTTLGAFTIDPEAHPAQAFRVDAFAVPTASRAEFEATMTANTAFITEQPGFEGHVALALRSGPTTYNVVTIAAWDSADAMQRAGDAVRAHYRSIGLDLRATMGRWGVTASIGTYRVAARIP